MLSNEIETAFEDGEWITKARAAVVFEVSERTIENRIKGGSLTSKVEEGKTLVFVKSSKLNPMGGENFPSPAKPFATIPQHIETSSKPCEECSNLREELSKEREARAKLEGILEGKDDLIAEKNARIQELSKAKDDLVASKDNEIIAVKGAFALLEQQKNPAIAAESSASEQPQLEAPQATNRPGWMVKVGRLFMGS